MGRVQVLQKELDDDGIEAFIEKYGIKLGRVISPLDPKKPAQTKTESVINLVVPEYWAEENEKIILRLRDGKTIQSIKKAVNDKGRKKIMDNKANIEARDKAIAEFNNPNIKPKIKPIINVKKQKTKEKPTFAQKIKETRIIPPQKLFKERYKKKRPMNEWDGVYHHFDTYQRLKYGRYGLKMTREDQEMFIRDHRDGIPSFLLPGPTIYDMTEKEKKVYKKSGDIPERIVPKMMGGSLSNQQIFIDESEVGQTTPAGANFSYGWADDAVDDIMELIAERFYEELRVDDENDGLLTEKELEDNVKYSNEQMIIKKELEQDRKINIQAMEKLQKALWWVKRKEILRKRDGREYRERLIRQRKREEEEERFKTIYQEYLYLELAVEISIDNMGSEADTPIDDMSYYKQLILEIEPEFNMSYDDEDPTWQVSYDRREDIEDLDIFPEIRKLFDKELLEYIKPYFDEEYKKYKPMKLKSDIVMSNEFGEEDEMIFYKRKALQYLDPDFNMDMSQQDEDFDDDIFEELNILETTKLYNRYVEDMKDTERYYIQKHYQEIERERIAKDERKRIRREKRKKEEAQAIIEKAEREKEKRRLLLEKLKYDDEDKEERYQDYKELYEVFVEAEENLDDNPDDEFYQKAYEEEDEELNDFFTKEEKEKDWDVDFEERYDKER